MTPKERLLAVFRGETPDKVPWFGDLTYWYNAMAEQGKLPEKYQGEGVVQLYKDLGVGAHEHVLAQPWRQSYDTDEIKVEHWQEEKSRGDLIAHTKWITPLGELHMVQQHELTSFSWAYLKYPVESVEDMRVLQFLCDHTLVEPDYSHQEYQVKLWGEQGVASTIPPRIPMANLIVVWMGVTNVSYALYDAPDELWRTIEALDRLDDKIYPLIADSPAPLVYFGDNITSEVVSPRIYKEYYLPFHKKRAEQIHKMGKYGFVHIDGTMRGVLEQIHLSKIDAAQSLTPYPVGDVKFEEMRELAGWDMILWTGVPGAYFSTVYPAETVKSTTLECLQHLKEGAKLIIGVCDQVPPDGEIERCKLVTEAIEEHGWY